MATLSWPQGGPSSLHLSAPACRGPRRHSPWSGSAGPPDPGSGWLSPTAGERSSPQPLTAADAGSGNVVRGPCIRLFPALAAAIELIWRVSPGFPEASRPGPAPPDAALARRVTALRGHSSAVAVGGHLLLPSRLIPSPRQALGPRALGRLPGTERTRCLQVSVYCAAQRRANHSQAGSGSLPPTSAFPLSPLPGPSPFPALPRSGRS